MALAEGGFNPYNSRVPSTRRARFRGPTMASDEVDRAQE